MLAAIVINDKRMAMLADLLDEKLELIRISKVADFCEALNFADKLETIILPMSGIDSEGKVYLSSGAIPMLNLLNLGNNKKIIFTGSVSPVLQHVQGCVINLSAFDSVKKCHAKLSAQAMLKIIIESLDYDFTQYSYDIFGYGECGKAIREVLNNNGCSYRIISRQNRQCKEMLSYQEYEKLKPAQILINTAHACVINETMVSRWQSRPLIIYDLASKGIGIEESIKQRMDVRELHSLPALAGPMTSALCLNQIILKELNL